MKFVGYDVCRLLMFVGILWLLNCNVCRLWCLSHYDVCRQLYAQSFKRKLKIWAWQTPRFLNRFLWKSLSGQTFKGLSITRTKLQRLHAHFRAVRSKDSDSCFMFKTLSFRGQRTWAQQKFLRSIVKREKGISLVFSVHFLSFLFSIFLRKKRTKKEYHD